MQVNIQNMIIEPASNMALFIKVFPASSLTMNHGSNSSVYIETKKKTKKRGIVSLSTTCLLPEPTSLLDTFCIWRTSELSVQVQRRSTCFSCKNRKGMPLFFSFRFLSFLDTTAIISYKNGQKG